MTPKTRVGNIDSQTKELSFRDWLKYCLSTGYIDLTAYDPYSVIPVALWPESYRYRKSDGSFGTRPNEWVEAVQVTALVLSYSAYSGRRLTHNEVANQCIACGYTLSSAVYSPNPESTNAHTYEMDTIYLGKLGDARRTFSTKRALDN